MAKKYKNLFILQQFKIQIIFYLNLIKRFFLDFLQKNRSQFCTSEKNFNIDDKKFLFAFSIAH